MFWLVVFEHVPNIGYDVPCYNYLYIFRFRFRPYQNPVSEQYMYDFRPLILIKVLNGLVPRIDMCTT